MRSDNDQQRDNIKLGSIRYTAAGLHESKSGLLGWVSCLLNGSIILDGLCIRRAQSGHLYLNFPARTDAKGDRHFYLKPLDDATRRSIEDQVFQALGLGREGAA